MTWKCKARRDRESYHLLFPPINLIRQQEEREIVVFSSRFARHFLEFILTHEICIRVQGICLDDQKIKYFSQPVDLKNTFPHHLSWKCRVLLEEQSHLMTCQPTHTLFQHAILPRDVLKAQYSGESICNFLSCVSLWLTPWWLWHTTIHSMICVFHYILTPWYWSLLLCVKTE